MRAAESAPARGTRLYYGLALAVAAVALLVLAFGGTCWQAQVEQQRPSPQLRPTMTTVPLDPVGPAWAYVGRPFSPPR